MATNKKKESAALFELIGKSTLKVPKTAGALKIPSWWSTKGNPTPEAAEGAVQGEANGAVLGGTGAGGAAKIDEKPAGDSKGSPEGKNGVTRWGKAANGERATEEENEVATAGEGTARAQPRLFEPPPANVAPMSSPSIRPPSASVPVPVSPSVKAPVAGSSVMPPQSFGGARETEVRPAGGAQESSAAAEAVVAGGGGGSMRNGAGPALSKTGAGSRIFAPQTRAQDRRPWSPPRPGAFARLPGWVIMAAAVGVVAIICGLIWVSRHKDVASAKAVPEGSTSVTGGTAGVSPAPVQGGSLLPPSNTVVGGGTGAGRGSGSGVAANNTGMPAGGGMGQSPGAGAVSRKPSVHEGGTVARAREKFYVIICRTPSLNIAQRNARFVAERGVDVSIEVISVNAKGDPWYAVITTEGFASQTAARPSWLKVKEIGLQLQKAYNLSGNFNDAEVMSGLYSPSAGQG